MGNEIATETPTNEDEKFCDEVMALASKHGFRSCLISVWNQSEVVKKGGTDCAVAFWGTPLDNFELLKMTVAKGVPLCLHRIELEKKGN